MFNKTPNPVILDLEGSESFDFLQNIVTNDISNIKTSQQNFILSPQGKIIFEIYISNFKGNYQIECSNNNDDLISYLSKYSLLSDVLLKNNDTIPHKYNDDYFINNLNNGYIDTNFLEAGKIYPSEISNNAVDYNKGCFVGQEVVSRMKHRQSNKNLIRVFKKILINNKIDKKIENFDIVLNYNDLLIVKFKESVKQNFLNYENNNYKIIDQNT